MRSLLPASLLLMLLGATACTDVRGISLGSVNTPAAARDAGADSDAGVAADAATVPPHDDGDDGH